MIHNLNHATTTLQNSKNYSSRVIIPDSGINELEQIFRRLYRIFAHIYLYHREAFNEFEVSFGVIREKIFCA